MLLFNDVDFCEIRKKHGTAFLHFVRTTWISVTSANDVIDLQIIYNKCVSAQIGAYIEKHANATGITNLISIILTNIQRICYIID